MTLIQKNEFWGAPALGRNDRFSHTCDVTGAGAGEEEERGTCLKSLVASEQPFFAPFF